MSDLTFIPYQFPESRDGKYILLQEDCQVLLSRREQLGLTQQQVADLANMQLRQYQRIESGERSLSSCSMNTGLSICAVLLLNPYDFIDIAVTQPDPSSIKEHPYIDVNLPEEFITEPKRPGRKAINRNAMTVYMNHEHYGLLIPARLLEALGKPDFFQFLYNPKENRIALRPSSENADQAIDIPRATYDGYTFAIPRSPITDAMKQQFSWGNGLYAADAKLVQDRQGTPAIIIDPSTATSSPAVSGPFVVPSCFSEEE